jgi:hypothetical protein
MMRMGMMRKKEKEKNGENEVYFEQRCRGDKTD